jgi:hypothetical protein
LQKFRQVFSPLHVARACAMPWHHAAMKVPRPSQAVQRPIPLRPDREAVNENAMRSFARAAIAEGLATRDPHIRPDYLAR